MPCGGSGPVDGGDDTRTVTHRTSESCAARSGAVGSTKTARDTPESLFPAQLFDVRRQRRKPVGRHGVRPQPRTGGHRSHGTALTQPQDNNSETWVRSGSTIYCQLPVQALLSGVAVVAGLHFAASRSPVAPLPPMSRILGQLGSDWMDEGTAQKEGKPAVGSRDVLYCGGCRPLAPVFFPSRCFVASTC